MQIFCLTKVGDVASLMFVISTSQTLVRSASQTLVIHSNFPRRTFAENFEHMELSQEKKEQHLRNMEIYMYHFKLL